MAQVQMTINVDSQMQQQIDRYCTLSGLTRKAVFKEMIDRWNQLFLIPEIEFLEKAECRRKAWAAIEHQRAKAERGKTPELTMEEIIAEIQQAHVERIHENR